MRVANLIGAHLERANIEMARLEGANLRWAHLEHAGLNEAHLEGADLFWAQALTQEQIDKADGDVETNLSDGLTRSARWATRKPPSDGRFPALPGG